MYELELKARVEHYDIEGHLAQLGCTLGPPVDQLDRIYLPAKSLRDEIEKITRLVRIRTEDGESHWLTLKCQGANRNEWWEHETGVSNLGEAEEILAGLGLKKVMEIRKRRRTGTWNRFTVCLDHVDELGKFLELESLVEDDTEASKLRRQGWALLSHLGVRTSDRVRVGYHVLMSKLRS